MGVKVGRQLCLQGADGVSTGRGPGRQQGSSLNALKLFSQYIQEGSAHPGSACQVANSGATEKVSQSSRCPPTVNP